MKMFLILTMLIGSSISFAAVGHDVTYSYNAYGQCINENSIVVAARFCQKNPGYQYLLNGQCVQTATGQLVATQLCQMNGMAQQCYGYYSYQGRNYQCGITTNCSGYQMTSSTTGQVVQCL